MGGDQEATGLILGLLPHFNGFFLVGSRKTAEAESCHGLVLDQWPLDVWLFHLFRLKLDRFHILANEEKNHDKFLPELQ
jgi:hypothetical protein